MRRLVDRVRVSVTRPAIDALVSFDKRGPKIRAGQDGVALDAIALRKRVEATILRPGASTVAATARIVHPAVTTKSLAGRYPYVIVVNRKDFRLKLFHDLHLQKTYKIAVGRVGLETPAGLYHIQNKAENPAWHVPKSAWAGKLAGKVIPAGDPGNPIKARWLGIFDGAGHPRHRRALLARDRRLARLRAHGDPGRDRAVRRGAGRGARLHRLAARSPRRAPRPTRCAAAGRSDRRVEETACR